MTMTSDQYEARIAELQAELERLKTSLRIAMPTGQTRLTVSAPGTGTILGVEEMVLHVSADRTLGFLNPPMATLLRVADRKAKLGKPLAELFARVQGIDFHVDVLLATLDSALGSGQVCVVESVFPDLAVELLPKLHDERPKSDPILRIVATPLKGAVQVSVQDVTYVRWLESTFSKYVAPHVIEQMRHTPPSELMTTRSCEVTVLFADLRGFTAMCEQLPPEGVRDTVNSFLCGMVASIEANNGTVDKFVGDEVMALFGAPLADRHHGLSAVLCALDMQARHAAWMEERRARQLPAPPMGIGLASGPVVVGNVGTPTRMDFTALGSTVNLAARLCGRAEGGEVLTVRRTHALVVEAAQAWRGPPLPHTRFGKKGRIELKNIAEPVEIISVHAAGVAS